jgi:hypothetical protein
MRLTLRFLALFLLLFVVTFTNSKTVTICAEEVGNPCLDGCARGDQNCRGACGLNAACLQKCDEEMRKCNAKCQSGDLPEEPPQN